MDYQKCLEFATLKHEGQFRKGGEAYVTHPIAVAKILNEKGYGLEYLCCALFHDTIEDTNTTYEEILELTNEEVAKAVVLLTKTKDKDMYGYIRGIMDNPMAKAVKLADRLHNLRSALVCDDRFRVKYVKETMDFYMSLGFKTCFYEDVKEALNKLVDSLDYE